MLLCLRTTQHLTFVVIGDFFLYFNWTENHAIAHLLLSLNIFLWNTLLVVSAICVRDYATGAQVQRSDMIGFLRVLRVSF